MHADGLLWSFNHTISVQQSMKGKLQMLEQNAGQTGGQKVTAAATGYRSHQTSPRTWSKWSIFSDHALGFPRVDFGSNGGQIGVKQV